MIMVPINAMTVLAAMTTITALTTILESMQGSALTKAVLECGSWDQNEGRCNQVLEVGPGLPNLLSEFSYVF